MSSFVLFCVYRYEQKFVVPCMTHILQGLLLYSAFTLGLLRKKWWDVQCTKSCVYNLTESSVHIEES